MAKYNKNPSLIFTILSGILLIVILYYPIFSHPFNFGINDHDYFNAWQLAVNAYLRKGELLQWMFWLCGGQPGLGNPQSGVLSPFNILGLIISPIVQFKIEFLLNASLGLLGFIYISKKNLGGYLPGLLGFVIFIGNGLVLSRILHGQSTYLPLLLTPLIIAILMDEASSGRRILPTKNNIILLVTVFLLILYQDGFHVLIYTSPFILLVVFGWKIKSGQYSVVVLFIITLIFVAILSLPRLLPIIHYLEKYPRIVDHTEALTIKELIFRLFDPDQTTYYLNANGAEAYKMGYLAYIGWLPTLLGTIMFLLPNKSYLSRWPLLIAILVSIFLAIGDNGIWSPWHYLSKLPVFENIRSPFKFIFVFILVISISATLGITYLLNTDKINNLKILNEKVIIIALIIFITGSFSYSNWPLLKLFQLPYQPPYENINWEMPFNQIYAKPEIVYDKSYSAVAHNIGIINCYEPLSINSSVSLDKPLVMLENNTGAINWRISPNHISIVYSVTAPSKLLINQNFDPGWKSNIPGSVLQPNVDGGMTVLLPRGEGNLELQYSSPGLKVGLICIFLFILLICMASIIFHKFPWLKINKFQL